MVPLFALVAAAAFGFVALGLLALAIDRYEHRQVIRRRLATYCSRQP